jgi:hypothetical protein
MITPQAPARLALLGLAASALTALAIDWVRAGHDAAGDEALLSQREQLDLALAMSQARMEVKKALAHDVAAGRLSLREAAERLHGHLDKEPVLGGTVPGRNCVSPETAAPLEERCAISLMSSVRNLLSGSPAGAERVARLERELAEGYRR